MENLSVLQLFFGLILALVLFALLALKNPIKPKDGFSWNWASWVGTVLLILGLVYAGWLAIWASPPEDLLSREKTQFRCLNREKTEWTLTVPAEKLELEQALLDYYLTQVGPGYTAFEPTVEVIKISRRRYWPHEKLIDFFSMAGSVTGKATPVGDGEPVELTIPLEPSCCSAKELMVRVRAFEGTTAATASSSSTPSPVTTGVAPIITPLVKDFPIGKLKH